MENNNNSKNREVGAPSNGKKVLITGGAGFIGSNLTKFLCDHGHEVTVIDDLSSAGHTPDEIDQRAKLVIGNIGDEKLLDTLIPGKEVVFHLAAAGIIKLSLEDPYFYFQNNVLNGVKLLEAMRRHGVKKIVYSSSSSAYGEPIKAPIPEDHPLNPINPYGASKICFEHVLSSYHHSFGINSVSLRYFNVYGPGDEQIPRTRAVPTWVVNAIEGKPLPLYWEGKQKKDYIFVEDVAQANLMAADKCDGFRFYNVGSGNGIWMHDLIKVLEKVMDKKLEVQQMGERKGDPTVTVGDISKITKELGWKPQVDLETGLRKTIEYYKKQLNK